jgi:hypothetical protein
MTTAQSSHHPPLQVKARLHPLRRSSSGAPAGFVAVPGCGITVSVEEAAAVMGKDCVATGSSSPLSIDTSPAFAVFWAAGTVIVEVEAVAVAPAGTPRIAYWAGVNRVAGEDVLGPDCGGGRVSVDTLRNALRGLRPRFAPVPRPRVGVGLGITGVLGVI